MKNASAVECMTYGIAVGEGKGGRILPRLKSIPWIRIIVDVALVAAIMAVSASFLTVR
ncbi:MAG: hypothetical protein ACLP59_01770 [Bryobacteraceae bacterium]